MTFQYNDRKSTIIEVIRNSWCLYRQVFWQLMPIIIVFGLVLHPLSVYALRHWEIGSGAVGAVTLLLLLVGLYQNIVLLYQAYETSVSESISLGHVLKYSFFKYFKMLLAYLVWWLVFLIGLILIVFVSFVLTMLYPPLKVEMGIATLVLAFAVGICFSQIGQNIIIRQDGVFASIRNSVKLVNKNYWRTGIMIIISLLPAILLAPLRVYLLPHGYYMHYTYALLYLVFSVFAMPWVISVRLVYYRDLLIRKNWA